MTMTTQHDLHDLDDVAEEFGVDLTSEPTPEAEKAEAPKEPSLTGMTLEEMSDTLTGFEEIAIAKAFEKPLESLLGMRVYRALAMIWHRRTDELNDADAYEAAMNLPLKECVGYFDEDEEITPSTPETDPGKDS